MDEKNEETKKEQDRQVEDYGQLTLDDGDVRIHLLNIIGEIEGHECLPSNSKTTKYEHVIPQLAALEDSRNIQGLDVYKRQDYPWPPEAVLPAGRRGIYLIEGRVE